MIWDKVALESVILHRLTQNSRNTVLPDTEYFENLVRKPTTATQNEDRRPKNEDSFKIILKSLENRSNMILA